MSAAARGGGSNRDPRPGKRGPGAPRGTLPAEPAAAPSRCTAGGGRVRQFPGGLAVETPCARTSLHGRCTTRQEAPRAISAPEAPGSSSGK